MTLNRESAPKHGITFWLCKPYDVPSGLDYYLVRANDDILSQIGTDLFNQGARLPGLENNVKQFPYNEDVRVKLQFLGLELMGAYVLSFDSEIGNSSDSSYHLTWQQDVTDKGHWTISLLVPSDEDSAITSVTAESLLCGDEPTVSFSDGVLHLGIPRGCDGMDGNDGIDGSDGSDGSDGREIELRVSGGYIEWKYTTDTVWTDLISVASLKGDKGDKGDTGATGATGSTGATGATGSTGATGATGADGEPCNTCPPDTSPTTASDGENTRCNVAAGVGAWVASKFADVITKFAADLADGVTLTHAIESLIGFVPLIGDIWSYFLDAVNDVYAAGIADTNAAFTTDFKASVVCLLYCRLDENGALTDTAIANWIADVIADTTYAPFSATYGKFLKSILPSNLRKIATLYQHISGACGCSCDGCITYNLETLHTLWLPVNSSATWDGTKYVNVSSVNGAGPGLYIIINIPDGTTITSIRAHGAYSGVDTGGDPVAFIRGMSEPDFGGTTLAETTTSNGSFSGNATWSGSLTTIRSIVISFLSNPGSVSGYIDEMELCGSGTLFVT